MKPKLQVWRFDESDYERPDALWVCGWAADGHPCRTGPDAKGRCQTIAECRPVKDGARWRCTRSSFAGGPCGEGPKDDGTCGRPVTPCQPARSAKAKRGAATLAAFVAAAGIVLAALGGDRTATAFVSPGRLAPPHAARGLECAQCHVAAETRDWVGAALTGLDDARPGIPGPAVAGSAGDAHTAPRILADAEKCLACHEPESRPLIMRAHGSPRGALGTTWGMSPRRDPSALPCGTCHIEHQGATFDPRGIDDARCDACHAKKIRSFGPGHPEFTALGTGLGHITFDHSSKTHAAERCADCHVPDESSDGRFLALRSFEIACARCHTVGITGSDPTSFRDPASLQRLPDAREATFAEDLRALACFVPGNPAAVGTAATLAATLPPEELAALPPPLPAAAIAKRPWVTNAGLRIQLPAANPGTLRASGEWTLSDGEYAYRPIAHADPVLHRMLDLIAGHSGRKPRHKDDGGRCTACHAAVESADGAYTIAWTANRTPSSPIVRFDHGAHAAQSCGSCHRPGPGTAFEAIPKATCAGCHRSGGAPTGCLTCHGYHAARFDTHVGVAPESVVGAEACAGCHPNATAAWSRSRHGVGRLDAEDRAPSAAAIATKLGLLGSPASSPRCVGCHSTVTSAAKESGAIECESCHGGARPWLALHGELSRPDHRAAARAAGMAGPGDAFALADACFGCHVIPDPALVAAGHLSGSPLDAMLWAEGEVRHRFSDGCLGTDTPVNREMPADRRRALALTGALLDLDYSLRALAVETSGDYADAMKNRVEKAAKKLRKLADADPALAARFEPILAGVDAVATDPGGATPLAVRARDLARELSRSPLPATLDDALGKKVKGAPWNPS